MGDYLLVRVHFEHRHCFREEFAHLSYALRFVLQRVVTELELGKVCALLGQLGEKFSHL